MHVQDNVPVGKPSTTAFLVPRPDNSPMSLIELYRLHTGDTSVSEEQVRDTVLSMSIARKRAVTLYLKGYTLQHIGAALGISYGSVASRVRGCMVGAWKKLHKIPYHHVTLKHILEYAVARPLDGNKVEILRASSTYRGARIKVCLWPGSVVVRCAGGCSKGKVMGKGEWELVSSDVSLDA